MALTYSAGSLVAARGREWVVLPESKPDLLVLRPLGGSDDDIAAVFPAFEEVKGAEFAAPEPSDLGDQRAAGLLRTALRIGFRSGAGPFRSLAGIAVEPRAYQLVPLLMALRQKTVRMLISDDVGIGKTIEAGLVASELLAQGEATGLAVLCSPPSPSSGSRSCAPSSASTPSWSSPPPSRAWSAAWTWASPSSTSIRTSSSRRTSSNPPVTATTSYGTAPIW